MIISTYQLTCTLCKQATKDTCTSKNLHALVHVCTWVNRTLFCPLNPAPSAVAGPPSQAEHRNLATGPWESVILQGAWEKKAKN